jgi:hypothetical protein
MTTIVMHDSSLADRFEAMAAQTTAALRLGAPDRDWLDEILNADGDGLTSSTAAYIADVSPDTICRRTEAAASTDRPLGILMAGAVWLISLRRLLDAIELRDGLPARLAAQSRADKNASLRLLPQNSTHLPLRPQIATGDGSQPA